MISEFALFVFTTLGGLAVGLYVAATLIPVKGKENLLITAIPLVLLAISGVALLLHLGHPERMFNAFRNLGAGIAQEGVCVALFGLVLLADFILTWKKDGAPRWLRILGSVFGLLLCLAMGHLYYAYESMPVWHQPETIWLFVFGGLAAGATLLPLVDAPVLWNRRFTVYYAIMAVVTILTLIAEGMLFANSGISAAPYAVTTCLAVLSVAALFVRPDKDVPWRRWVVFALMVVAIVAARYAFYAIL